MIRRFRDFGALDRMPLFCTLDRRELIDLRHKCAKPGGGARRPWRWRGPRWLLYQPRR